MIDVGPVDFQAFYNAKSEDLYMIINGTFRIFLGRYESLTDGEGIDFRITFRRDDFDEESGPSLFPVGRDITHIIPISSDEFKNLFLEKGGPSAHLFIDNLENLLNL